MTELDMNIAAKIPAASMMAECGAQEETIGMRQARLAGALCETFFLQLKLINTAMTALPLGWLRNDAEPVATEATDSPEPSPAASEAASSQDHDSVGPNRSEAMMAVAKELEEDRRENPISASSHPVPAAVCETPVTGIVPDCQKSAAAPAAKKTKAPRKKTSRSKTTF